MLPGTNPLNPHFHSGAGEGEGGYPTIVWGNLRRARCCARSSPSPQWLAREPAMAPSAARPQFISPHLPAKQNCCANKGRKSPLISRISQSSMSTLCKLNASVCPHVPSSQPWFLDKNPEVTGNNTSSTPIEAAREPRNQTRLIPSSGNRQVEIVNLVIHTKRPSSWCRRNGNNRCCGPWGWSCREAPLYSVLRAWIFNCRYFFGEEPRPCTQHRKRRRESGTLLALA